MVTQGHGEHPAAASGCRTLGKKYRTTQFERRSSGRAQIIMLTAAWRLTRAVGCTDSFSPTAKRFGGTAQRGGAQRSISDSTLSFSHFV